VAGLRDQKSALNPGRTNNNTAAQLSQKSLGGSTGRALVNCCYCAMISIIYWSGLPNGKCMFDSTSWLHGIAVTPLGIIGNIPAWLKICFVMYASKQYDEQMKIKNRKIKGNENNKSA
jgi:hypothetical protein